MGAATLSTTTPSRPLKTSVSLRTSCKIEARLAAADSSATVIVATTFTLAAVTDREMSSGATSRAVARLSLKPPSSKVSTVASKTSATTTTGCV